MERNSAANLRSRGFILAILVIALLAGLPIAAWLDLSDLTDRALHRQAADLNSVITSMRSYYASNVVGRILASSGSTEVAHNYQSIPGAVPIPATLSLELGRVISEQQHNIIYRFISDYPFENRAPHVFDDFERRALDCIKQNDDGPRGGASSRSDHHAGGPAQTAHGLLRTLLRRRRRLDLLWA